MPELEIKETIEDFIGLLRALGHYSNEKLIAKFLSRFEDILNHINMHDLAHDAEISCLKIRIEELEKIDK